MLDNYATHKTPSVHRCCCATPAFISTSPRTSSSWHTRCTSRESNCELGTQDTSATPDPIGGSTRSSLVSEASGQRDGRSLSRRRYPRPDQRRATAGTVVGEVPNLCPNALYVTCEPVDRLGGATADTAPTGGGPHRRTSLGEELSQLPICPPPRRLATASPRLERGQRARRGGTGRLSHPVSTPPHLSEARRALCPPRVVVGAVRSPSLGRCRGNQSIQAARDVQAASGLLANGDNAGAGSRDVVPGVHAPVEATECDNRAPSGGESRCPPGTFLGDKTSCDPLR